MLSSRGRRLSGSSWRLITEWHLLLTNAACRLKGWKRIPRSGSPGTKSLASGSCQIFVSLRQQLKAIIHDIGISKEFLSNFFLISRFGMRIFFHEYSISCILEKPKQFLVSWLSQGLVTHLSASARALSPPASSGLASSLFSLRNISYSERAKGG